MSSPPSSTVFSASLKILKGLLNSFSDQLSNCAPNKTSISNPPNALALLHDSISILRAQVTKLSLLLLNKPFTPSAIASVLTSISTECLPGLMTVYEVCSPDTYGKVMQTEVRNQLRDLVSAMRHLGDQTASMPDFANMNAPEGPEGSKDLIGRREEILQVTGQVWSVCDRILAIASFGIVGLAMNNAKQWEALIKDAIEELEEWDPDADDDFDMDLDSEHEEKSSGEKVSGSAVKDEQQHQVNDAPTVRIKHQSNGTVLDEDNTTLSSTSQPPSTDPPPMTNIHSTKAKVLKLLKLIKMLFPALRKRRISTFPPFTRLDTTSSLPPVHQIKQFSDVLAFCEDFSTATDDLAGALYDQAADAVQAKMELTIAMACRCVDRVKKGWNEEEDEFTAWSGKWIARARDVADVTPEEDLKLSKRYEGLSLG
ncbi:MAG: hypothetical protein Q9204_007758 [Flavoplaca sp. TL-2023a]